MPTARTAYWQEMKSMAAENMSRVSELMKPESESDAKNALAHVFRLGSSSDMAEACIEACEYICACHMLKAAAIAG